MDTFFEADSLSKIMFFYQDTDQNQDPGNISQGGPLTYFTDGVGSKGFFLGIKFWPKKIVFLDL